MCKQKSLQKSLLFHCDIVSILFLMQQSLSLFAVKKWLTAAFPACCPFSWVIKKVSFSLSWKFLVYPCSGMKKITKMIVSSFFWD